MKRKFTIGRIWTALAIIVLSLAICVVAVACDDTDDKKVTLTFIAEGAPSIASITALPGETITPPSDPQKEGYDFIGWYTNESFEGDSVTLPTVMPNKSTTYYARFEPNTVDYAVKVFYDKNNPLITSYTAITPSGGDVGDNVVVKDGEDFNVQGYMFVGWSVEKDGLVSRFGNKLDGQYLPDDEITLGENDITLYAQWAVEITGETSASGEKLYFYSEYVDHGNGGIFRVREVAGQNTPDVKLGFVSSASRDDAYWVFTFYEDDGNDGVLEIEGRIFDDFTYVYRDETFGLYLAYDYVDGSYYEYMLRTDGYGYAIVSTLVGIQTKVEYSGLYAYNSKYGDFTFNGFNEFEEEVEFGFILEKCKVVVENLQGNFAETEFDGKFVEQGYESGAFLAYVNGTLSNMRLELNGYGVARLVEFDDRTEQTSVVAVGTYKGTEYYEDVYGEWQFTPSGSEDGFKFILNSISDVLNNAIPVYIEYNEDYDVTLTGENGETLYIDGYGSALYTAVGGVEYMGSVKIGETVITFIPYISDGEGGVVAGNAMYFNADWTENTFTVDESDFVIDGTTLTDYLGTSQIVVIPSGVTAIANNVFNGKNLVSVTIPASVTSIGVRAFQNENTLTRVVFLADNPIVIDWSSANDPFRWPSGSFVIVVPEGRQEAYKTAWEDCKYAIKGSVEVTELPEFEIEEGVLVRYNLQTEGDEPLDIVIPDEVTEIAASVFRGLGVLRSVDLNNVTKIGDGAFEFCENLVSILNFDKVRIIDDGAFNGCINLGKADGESDGVIILTQIETVGNNSFQGCTSLKYVKLGVNLMSIGNMAFREVNIYSLTDVLFVELLGENVPEMGEKVFVGNISQRIKVQNMDVAIKCFNDGGFSAYVKHLYVESGAEKGTYYDGSAMLEVDGRAVLMGSIVMWYVIDGEKITFHTFDQDGYYMTIDGTYIDEVISFEVSVVEDGNVVSKQYNFEKVDGNRTYTSEDGKFVLVVNPEDLQPEKYADSNYSGQADATLNGTAVKVEISAYSAFRILSFVHSDGLKYDITFTVDGNKLVISKMDRAAMYIRNITATDGSVINVHVTANTIYVFGSLKIVVGTDADGKDIFLPEFSDWGTEAQNPSENVFVFNRECNVKDAEGKYTRYIYSITVTLSADGTAFEYEYQIVG